jgi:hypothetical protein
MKPVALAECNSSRKVADPNRPPGYSGDRNIRDGKGKAGGKTRIQHITKYLRHSVNLQHSMIRLDHR